MVGDSKDFLECLCVIAVLSSVSCGVLMLFSVVGEEGDCGLTWCHF